MANLKPRASLAAADSLPGVLFDGVQRTPELGETNPDSDAPDSLTEFRVPGAVLPRQGDENNEWVLPAMAPPAPLPRLVSSGTYDIALEMGGGAMATVYMAVKSGSNGFRKIVALKRIHKHLANNSTFVDMLVDEARLASRINHPNVCQVLDFGCDDSGYYIALEFLSGQTLQSIFDVLAVKPQALMHERHQFIVSRIVASLAQGLHAAHNLKGDDGLSLEVVHRDVTPHNLFLLYDGMVKVTDFGVARARSRIHHTADGALKGKLAYMAPEQISRRTLDRRADVFALGVVLWEMLTGRRLFDYKSEAETLTAVCSGGVPAPSRYQSRISPQLDAIVLRALSVRETERYQTAREFSGALETFMARSADTVPLVDLIDWLAELFPGAEADAEAVQRKVLETAPSISELDRPRFAPAPAASVAQMKSAHTLSDEELWPMGDSSPPSRAGGSVDAVLRHAEAAPAPLIIPSEEQATKDYSPTAIRRALGEVAESKAPDAPSNDKRKLGSTLWLTALALLVGVVAGLIGQRHHFVDATPPVVVSPLPDTPVASVSAAAPVIAVPAPAPSPAPGPVPSAELAAPARDRRAPPQDANASAALGSGAVFVTGKSGPVTILVGGKRQGTAPLILNLPVGQRIVTLVPRDGQAPRNIAVQVSAHETSVINVDFNTGSASTPSSAAAASTAASSVTKGSVPPAAEGPSD